MSVPSPDPATIRFVDVDGVRLRTSRCRGIRPAAAADHRHSAPASTSASRSNANSISRGVQTISFDAPGVGESTGVRLAAADARRRPHRRAMLDALGYDRSTCSGSRSAVSSPSSSPTRPRAACAGSCSPRPGPGSAACPGHRGAARRWPPRAATTSPTTTGAIAGRIYGGAGPHATRTRCCTARPPGSSSRPRCADTSASSTPSPAGPACPGCAVSASRRSCSPATTTRSCRRSTGASSPGCIPDARLHVVRGGGHLFLLERPSEMATLVADFVVGAGDRSR